MNLENDEHLDVLQNIEVGLKQIYEKYPDLTDQLCAFALDNAKIAVKKQFGFAKNEKVTDHPLALDIIEWCVAVGVERIGKINALTLAEYATRIEKVKRSVIRHSANDNRGYYKFIKDYV